VTQPSPTASTDATRGILWILFGMVLFTNVNAITKILTETYPLVEVVWSRFLFHSLFVVLVFRGRIPSLLASNAPRLQIGRSAIMLATTTLIFLSLHLNPMVETSAILATAPIILTALSGPVLGEPVGLRRWVAVLIAFTGAVIIIRPGSAMMQTVIFAPVVAAFSLAFYQTATRLVSRRDLVMTTVVYTPIVGLVVSSMAVPFVWVMPTPGDWLLMAAFGAFGLGAHFTLIKAFDAAPAATVAPFNYSGILWAALYGYFIFGDIPDGWTIAGAAVICGAGLFIYREELSPKAGRTEG
jgi:drug/metabolite transporter (DMT)-like permease